MITRRSLLKTIGALVAAPAVVRASSLMPVQSRPLLRSVGGVSYMVAPGFLWQDAAGTIPALHDGDPVARMDAVEGGPPMVASDHARPPVLRNGAIMFDGGQSFRFEDTLPAYSSVTVFRA